MAQHVSPGPAVSVVVVNHRSGALAARALESLRAEPVVAASGARGVETIVVDNASGEEDRRPVAAVADRCLVNDENRGFAAAANQGLALATGQAVLFSNPDTHYPPGSLAELLRVLESNPGTGVVGPRVHWDLERRFLLPPSDPPTLASHLAAALAERSPAWARFHERRWSARALRSWQATAPHRVPMLSGAALLCSRAALAHLGGFDERFFLYFEDADWCRRAGRAGFARLAVPGAAMTHFYNQSARRDAEAAARHFARSAETFFVAHYGRFAWGLVARLAERLRRRPAPRPPASDLGDVDAPPRLAVPADGAKSRWLLLSPHPSGIPAIGHRIESDEVRIPAACWESLGPGDLYAHVLALPGMRTTARWRWRKASGFDRGAEKRSESGAVELPR